MLSIIMYNLGQILVMFCCVQKFNNYALKRPVMDSNHHAKFHPCISSGFRDTPWMSWIPSTGHGRCNVPTGKAELDSQ